LLVSTGSGVAALIWAVLVTVPLLLVPVDGTCAWIAICACAPGAKLAALQVTTVRSALLVHDQPPGPDTPLTWKPSGNASRRTTVVAALGPSLRAVSV